MKIFGWKILSDYGNCGELESKFIVLNYMFLVYGYWFEYNIKFKFLDILV